MNQSALAQKIGVSFQQVQKYEKGTNRVSAGLLPVIAEILGVSIGYFYGLADAAAASTPQTLLTASACRANATRPSCSPAFVR